MSRTIRRKNGFYNGRCRKKNGQWITCSGKASTVEQSRKDTVQDIEKVHKSNHKYLDVPEGTKAFEMAKHEYHGDTHKGYGYSVPADFVNTYATRPNRAKNRRNCHNMTKDPETWYDVDLNETSASKGIWWLYT